MALMWITTIGFAICLGLVGGVFIYFLNHALDTEDSTRIDLLPNFQNGDKHS